MQQKMKISVIYITNNIEILIINYGLNKYATIIHRLY
jgi:hypothetical protein